MIPKTNYFFRVFALTLIVSSSLAVPNPPAVHAKRASEPPMICPEPRTTKPQDSKYCGRRATLNPQSTHYTSFRVYDVHECAQRCYNTNPPCASFGIKGPEPPHTLAKCNLFSQPLTSMGWELNNQSAVTYYGGRCFQEKSYPTDPIQDGGFENSGSPVKDPWTGFDRGRLDTYDSDGDGNHFASLELSSSFDSRRRLRKRYYTSMNQQFPTCPNSTYRLEFTELHSYFYGKTEFYILINKVTVYEQKRRLRGAEIAPIYFTTDKASTDIVFDVHGHTSYYHYDAGISVEVDNVQTLILYRSEVPQNSTVYRV